MIELVEEEELEGGWGLGNGGERGGDGVGGRSVNGEVGRYFRGIRGFWCLSKEEAGIGV